MKKAFKMPTALTIVMIFLIIVGIMTWFVPTSVVIENDAGEKEIVFNAAFDEDGNVIENAGTSPVGLWDLFTAPINGMTDAVEVASAILVSGGLIAVLTKVGAMDAAIGGLLRKFKGSTLIIILMIKFLTKLFINLTLITLLIILNQKLFHIKVSYLVLLLYNTHNYLMLSYFLL